MLDEFFSRFLAETDSEGLGRYIYDLWSGLTSARLTAVFVNTCISLRDLLPRFKKKKSSAASYNQTTSRTVTSDSISHCKELCLVL